MKVCSDQMFTDPSISSDELRRMLRAVRRYYEDNLMQAEIAAELGVSRATVSRLLVRARQLGIVDIRIRDPFDADADMESRLSSIGSATVIVVSCSDDGTLDYRRQRLGRAAAEYLVSVLTPSDVLGVGWGRTLSAMAKAVPTTAIPLRLVPLVGGLGQVSPNYQVHEITRIIAERLGGSWLPCYVPAIGRDTAVWRALMDSPEVLAMQDAWSSVTTAVVGIGGQPTGDVQALFAEYLTDRVLRGLRRSAAAGDICMRFFDRAGNPIYDAMPRVIGIGWDQLKGIKRVVAVAGGADKGEAVLGALRSGIIDVLVTDEAAARRAVEVHGNEG